MSSYSWVIGAILFLPGILVGLGLATLLWSKQARAILADSSSSGWAAAFGAWGATVVAIAALWYANQSTALQIEDEHKQTQAVVNQFKLESAPVLTETCSFPFEHPTWDQERSFAPFYNDGLIADLVTHDDISALAFNGRGSSVLCSIHNYSRLPALQIDFRYTLSYCSAPSVMDHVQILAIAAGGERNILLLNQSNEYTAAVIPLSATQFIMPPTVGFQQYSYPGGIIGDHTFELNPSPPSTQFPGNQVPPNGHDRYAATCRSANAAYIASRQAERTQSASAFQIGEVVQPNLPLSDPYGWRKEKSWKCEPHFKLWQSRVKQQVYVEANKPLRIIGFSRDRMMATLRSSDGTLICAFTQNLQVLP